ncbi:helix-turn-helix domain-containing protein [Planobispora longispora]|uniref:Transcriptional regulator n=1 Tax=Planobispora longispora TaxID=28887 RepID=A0A8J3W8Z7_9ACTN|nr:helix-turn-helix transcriptional regulator [Planobispora longispora]BFE85541.1 helix-turn-helix transcriptional regulator [Planobispora longispora]GIH80420.1 transcriptional regulator [Planobispora longispora]
MLERGSPTVRRLRLGQELRRLRERRALSGEDVATRLKWSASKVSRIENAKTMPRRSDVEALAGLYEVDEVRQQELLDLHQDATRRGWWEDYSDSLSPEVITLLGLEAEATSALNWEPQIVPGLLQTEDYAREVIRATQAVMRIPPGELRDLVKTRMARQDHLLRSADPLRLWVVLDESVLLRRFGGASVMREQLERLIEWSRLPNIRVQVLSLSGSNPVNSGSFLHLTFPDFHDMVYLEALHDSRFVENEKLVYDYEIAFSQLQSEAFGVDASRELIGNVIEERWR